MSRGAISVLGDDLSQFEGLRLVSAGEALLKGVLEADIEVAVIAGAEFGGRMLQRAIHQEQVRSEARSTVMTGQQLWEALRDHDLRLSAAPSAACALTRAINAARSGKAGVVLISNEEIDSIMGALNRTAAEWKGRFTGNSAMVVVVEDAPTRVPATCPILAAQRLNLPCVVPCDLSQWRESVEHALRLSRAARSPAAVVVHESILRTMDMLEMRPNRVLHSADALLARRKRQGAGATRWADGTGSLRTARRLELNCFRSVPSPGERVSIGFITVGPADASLMHITNALGLHGRVPVLQLGMVHPLDDAAVGRMLTRCQRVIVMEPRPGSVESVVLAIAEAMRRKGEQPATVWGREIPDAPEAPDGRKGDRQSGETASAVPAPSPERSSRAIDSPLYELHPSIMVRRVAHLLHAIRPTAQISSQLEPDPAAWSSRLPPREATMGPSAALSAIRRVLTEVDQSLRERPTVDEDSPPSRTGLAIDGAEAIGAVDRMVVVETWDHDHFISDGLSSVVQAASELAPWLFVVCESSTGSIRDLERLTRGVIPAVDADRVAIHTVDLNDRAALRDLILSSAVEERLTVIIVRDGPPARFDAAAAVAAFSEVDRLGFEPRQRVVRLADDVCALRPSIGIETDDRSTLAAFDNVELKTSFTRQIVPPSRGSGLWIHVKPLVEEVEVIRTRPPLMTWRDERTSRPPTPTPLHAKSSQWRVHLAGYRGESPGVIAEVLCRAGLHMGYHVRCVSDPTPTAPGQSAWSQVLFTQRSVGRGGVPLTTVIPYGEADVVLGFDQTELARALADDPLLRVASPDRTYLVANGDRDFAPDPFDHAINRTNGSTFDPTYGGSEADADHPQQNATGTVPLHGASARGGAMLRALCRAEPIMLQDFAGACRAWFHTERVADFAILGAAYQLGFVPVSPESIDSAVEAVQSRGYGRSREAFEFGRRLAVDLTLFQQPEHEQVDVLERLIRRIVLSLSRGEWGGGSRARVFHSLIKQRLDAMSGLGETESGRATQQDFVLACHRCRIWGGFHYAQRYADLIMGVYRMDRGDTGRWLTRHLVLPLAEVMLIRDPVFIAGMANSSEQRRSLRQMLNVKLARGDRIERRFLTRIECSVFNRVYRADARTSDWPARAASALRRIIPHPWRGTRRDRELREYIVDVIKRVTAGASNEYEHWIEPVRRLHHYAAEGRLRGAALAEVKMLLESTAEEPRQLEPGVVHLEEPTWAKKDEATPGS